VATLSLLEGGFVDRPADAMYRYGDLTLYESAQPPEVVAAEWPAETKEGVAPHGPYQNVFDHPDSWPPQGVPIHDPWVSHWRPIGSLRREDV
jgi:hypothetical protein